MPSGELPVVGIVEIKDTMIRSAILVLVICGALPGVLGGKFWTKHIIYFTYEHSFTGGLITKTKYCKFGHFREFLFRECEVT